MVLRLMCPNFVYFFVVYMFVSKPLKHKLTKNSHHIYISFKYINFTEKKTVNKTLINLANYLLFHIQSPKTYKNTKKKLL